MKKNIIIAILSVISVSSMVFAVYQQTVANKLRIEAEYAAMEAKKQAAIANENAVEAMRQHEAVVVANRNLEEALAQLKKTK